MSVQYVVDENGKHVSVVLDIEEYERIVEELEDAADAWAAGEVRAAVARGDEEFVPYEQAREETMRRRAAKR